MMMNLPLQASRSLRLGGGLSSTSVRKSFQYTSQRFKATRAETSTAAVATAGSKPLALRLWKAYTSALEHSPVTTKMTAAALIFFTSDTATQKIMDPEASWDGARATSGAVFGVVATGRSFNHSFSRLTMKRAPLALISSFVSHTAFLPLSVPKATYTSGGGFWNAPLERLFRWRVTGSLTRLPK